MNVAVREIENRFSEYLRRMQAGEEIVVTDRGKPVARLVPAEPVAVEAEQAAVERFRSLPWVRRGKGGKIRGARDPIRIRAGEKTLAEIVEEDRGVILYLDTSALVKVYADEDHSALVRQAIEAADTVTTHAIAYIEARAALARKVREESLDSRQWARCKEDLDADWEVLDVIELTDTLRLRAADLAEQHALRGFDSLHLAVAESAWQVSAAEGGFLFAVFDGRLTRAARAHGLPLLD